MTMELIVDSFAGGGGASTGIEMALGRSPDVAINHDAEALALHAANHPASEHLDSNIWRIDPAEIARRGPIGLLWASPDCKHHSKAKGGKPREKAIRDLAWVVVLWAQRARPRVIILENVEEFADWGPLGADNMPLPDRRGETFRKWIRALRREGYRVEWRELRACDYGAPTIRKRLFLIARRDEAPIVWPRPTHGKPGSPAVVAGKLLPWRSAAEIIDWSLPCPSIFATAEEIRQAFGIRAKRPLAEATMARIAKGVMRYVIQASQPFIVGVGSRAAQSPARGVDQPVGTITCTKRGDRALVVPFGTYGQQGGAVRSIDEPLQTVTASRKDTNAIVAPFVTKFRQGAVGHALDDPLCTVTANSYVKRPGGSAPIGIVAPYLVPRYGEREGQAPRAQSVEAPLATVVPDGNGASLVAACLSRQFGGSVGSPAEDPVGTITAGGGGKTAVVAAFLAQHNTGLVGHAPAAPVSTIIGRGCTQGVVAAHLLNLRGADRRGGPADLPCPTITGGGNHVAEVRAFLCKYYGEGGQWADCRDPMPTDTTKPRFGLVTVQGEPYEIVDIGMRMLTPRERFRAQGFPESYVIDLEIGGRPITAEAQGRMVGNSVCPPIAAALVAANCADMAAGAGAEVAA